MLLPCTEEGADSQGQGLATNFQLALTLLSFEACISFNWLEHYFILKAHISHLLDAMRCVDGMELNQIPIFMTKLVTIIKLLKSPLDPKPCLWYYDFCGQNSSKVMKRTLADISHLIQHWYINVPKLIGIKSQNRWCRHIKFSLILHMHLFKHILWIIYSIFCTVLWPLNNW